MQIIYQFYYVTTAYLDFTFVINQTLIIPLLLLIFSDNRPFFLLK